MLTITDCIEMSGLDPREIDGIVEHEHIPYIVALEKGADLLTHPWGAPAIRQMMWDDLQHAEEIGDTRHVEEWRADFNLACRLHRGGVDRRQETRH